MLFGAGLLRNWITWFSSNTKRLYCNLVHLNRNLKCVLFLVFFSVVVYMCGIAAKGFDAFTSIMNSRQSTDSTIEKIPVLVVNDEEKIVQVDSLSTQPIVHNPSAEGKSIKPT